MRLYLAKSVERSAVWQPVHRDLEVRAAYMPDAARAYHVIPQTDLKGSASPRFRHRLSEFRRFIGGLLAFASLNRACETDHLGACNKLAHGRLANARCIAHLSDAEPELVGKTQHLTNLPHRHPLLWHRLPPLFLVDRGADQLIRVSTGALPARAYRQLLVII